MSYISDRMNFVKGYYNNIENLFQNNSKSIQTALKGNPLNFKCSDGTDFNFKYFNSDGQIGGSLSLNSNDNNIPLVSVIKNNKDINFAYITAILVIAAALLIDVVAGVILLGICGFLLISGRADLGVVGDKVLKFLKLKKSKISKKEFFNFYKSTKKIMYHEFTHLYDFKYNNEWMMKKSEKYSMKFFDYINDEMEISAFLISTFGLYSEKYDIINCKFKDFKEFKSSFMFYFYQTNPRYLLANEKTKSFINDKLYEWYQENHC
jgi:hypothetical protein